MAEYLLNATQIIGTTLRGAWVVFWSSLVSCDIMAQPLSTCLSSPSIICSNQTHLSTNIQYFLLIFSEMHPASTHLTSWNLYWDFLLIIWSTRLDNTWLNPLSISLQHCFWWSWLKIEDDLCRRMRLTGWRYWCSCWTQ